MALKKILKERFHPNIAKKKEKKKSRRGTGPKIGGGK